ncbi:MAG: DUF2975 domain-containing protein [Bacteroidales bacterium]
MKRKLIVFIQVAIVLWGIAVVAFLLWVPTTEGRATGMDLVSIYLDPFILYMYSASLAFFIALYKVFKLLGYVGEDKLYTSNSVKALKCIKYCSIVEAALFIAAGIYIRFSHNSGDDPMGFLAICAVVTFISIVVAFVANKLESIIGCGKTIH